MRLLAAKTLNLSKERSLVQWLNYFFNKVDHNRLKLVGPDRACAEWLMRNGAFIRWRNCPNFVAHYNDLPLDENQASNLAIEEVRAEEASITHHGFLHFRGCSCINKMTFKKCQYFNDACVFHLSYAENLKDLTITDCPEVTCHGIMQLSNFQNLQCLTLGKSKHFTGPTHAGVISALQASLPRCKVIPDPCELK